MDYNAKKSSLRSATKCRCQFPCQFRCRAVEIPLSADRSNRMQAYDLEWIFPILGRLEDAKCDFSPAAGENRALSQAAECRL